MESGTKLSKNGEGDHVDANKYRSLIESLRYLTNTRPNLMLNIGVTSHFMEESRYSHWKELKRILRYVKGTMSIRLWYTKSDNYRLSKYLDNDWCGDVNDRNSTVCYVFIVGDTTFTWLSRKQPIVALPTCEAEYVATSWSVLHAIWLRNILKNFEIMQEENVLIRLDNRLTIDLAKNPINHERSKHVDVRFHFIQKKMKKGSVKLEHVKSKKQISDIFTKALPTTSFQKLRKLIGMKEEKI
ncbi:secreted RxLR effector protein 161-like [Vigna angularis]|uniref:secreted RxLR effector protein 161-like n=1 Tax=Phaseolus angularis TaxID=3914 RepID=UPI0022B460DB|nr:secreted RxLR effector protein 161-like [Vigna angularis]